MTNPETSAGAEEADAFSPEEYALFIGQIELSRIWLRSVRVDNHHGPETPERVTIGIDSSATYSELPGGFQVQHTYQLHVDSTDTRLADIKVTFALDYESRQAITDSIFAVFADANLPLNSWPYLREYVSTTIGRMGWVPVTLPALKRGTSAQPLQDDAPSPPTPTRRRRARTKRQS